jgi:hypothetical protein
MAPWTSKDAAAQPHELGLSDLLTVDQRSELTLLIANITEVMRKQIEDIFEATLPAAKEPAQALHLTDKNPNIDVNKKSEQTLDENAKDIKEKEKDEVPDIKLQALKKDALIFFHQWQEEVVGRVGEVVNTKETAETQKEEAVASTTPDVPPPPDNKVVSKSKSLQQCHIPLFISSVQILTDPPRCEYKQRRCRRCFD